MAYVAVGAVQAHRNAQEIETVELWHASFVGYAAVVTEVEHCTQVQFPGGIFVYLFQERVGVMNGIQIVQDIVLHTGLAPTGCLFGYLFMKLK